MSQTVWLCADETETETALVKKGVLYCTIVREGSSSGRREDEDEVRKDGESKIVMPRRCLLPSRKGGLLFLTYMLMPD